MRYSRGGIIAVLLAVEVFIAGAIIWSFTGGGLRIQAAGLHTVNQPGKTFAAIDAGDAPHVVIDDPDSGVGITVSNDGKVHVADASAIAGLVWGRTSRPPLHVSKTADGVLIQRAADSGVRFSVFGFDREHIDVAIPAGTILDVRHCSGADVSGLAGDLRVHSNDGHIALENVHAKALTLSSDDGSLRMNDVSAPTIDASTNDGSIRASQLHVGGGTIHTNDGSVRLVLLLSDLTVTARTSDGSVFFNGKRTMESDSDSNSGEFQIGNGGSALAVTTQDGNIHITTNGAL